MQIRRMRWARPSPHVGGGRAHAWPPRRFCGCDLLLIDKRSPEQPPCDLSSESTSPGRPRRPHAAREERLLASGESTNAFVRGTVRPRTCRPQDGERFSRFA
eukprot:6188375-Pleurochrysis_carterae.AAC.1